MNKQVLVSNTPVYIHIVSIFFGGIFLIAISGSVLSWINDVIVAFDFQRLINLVRLIFLIGTLLAMLLALIRSKKYRYELAEDGILVSSGGLSGKNALYRYADIKGIRISRSYFGNMQGYGNIVIKFGGIAGGGDLVLRNIEKPDEILRYINLKCGLNTYL